MINAMLWWRMRGLRSPDSRKRSRSVTRLGNLRDTRTVPYLIRALDDQESCVREKAAEALKTLRDPRVVPALVSAIPSLGWKAVSCLNALDPAWRDSGAYREALPGLLTRMEDRRSHTAYLIADALIHAKEPQAISPLLVALDDPDSENYLRSLAIRVAGETRRGDLSQKLLPLLENPFFFSFFNDAAEALGALRDPAAVGPLVDRLSRIPAKDNEKVLTITRALDEIDAKWRERPDGACVLTRFVERLDEGAWEERSSAIRAAAALGVPGLPDRLVPLLLDPESMVRLVAKDGLSKDGCWQPGWNGLSGEGLARLVDGFARSPATAPLEVLEFLQDRLLTMFSDAPDQRFPAAIALGHLGRREAIPVLAELMREVESPFWREAMVLLGRFGGGEAFAALASALPSRPNWSSLIYSVAAAGGPGARSELLAHLSRPEANRSVAGLVLQIVPEDPGVLDDQDRELLLCLADSRRLYGLDGRQSSVTFMGGRDVQFFRTLASRFPSEEVLWIIATDLGFRSNIEMTRLQEYEDVLVLAARGMEAAVVDRILSGCSNWPRVCKAVRARLAAARTTA